MTDKDKNINKVPNLRFPGFTSDWETRKLGEVCEINPKNGILPNSFIYIDLESVIDGILLKEDTVLKEEAPSRAQRLLSRNDILFQMVRPYQKNNLYFDKEGDYVASTGYAQIRTLQNSQFVFQYLHNQKFVDKVIERCTGTSYPAINSKDLGNIKLYFPSIQEQKKIADFLSTLDFKIQTQRKTIQNLETLIKSVSQKLFTQKIRFKEFTDEWKITTLGKVLNEPKQVPVEKPNEIELLTVKLHCKGIENTGNYPAVTKNGRPYYRRFKNEILIGRQNFHNGGIGIVKSENDGKICSNAISSYNVLTDNLLFVYFYISRPQYYTRVDDLIGGTGQKEISKSEFSKLKIN